MEHVTTRRRRVVRASRRRRDVRKSGGEGIGDHDPLSRVRPEVGNGEAPGRSTTRERSGLDEPEVRTRGDVVARRVCGRRVRRDRVRRSASIRPRDEAVRRPGNRLRRRRAHRIGGALDDGATERRRPARAPDGQLEPRRRRLEREHDGARIELPRLLARQAARVGNREAQLEMRGVLMVRRDERARRDAAPSTGSGVRDSRTDTRRGAVRAARGTPTREAFPAAGRWPTRRS